MSELANRRKRKTKKKNRSIVEKPCEYFPSGSTRLNLILSGHPDIGWARARHLNIVGDKSSGKTLLALEALANFYYSVPRMKSNIFKKKSKIQIVYNTSEGIPDFNIKLMYGKKFYKDLVFIFSPHCQHLGSDFIRRSKALNKDEALLYVADSWDFFRSREQLKRFDKSVEEDTKIEGSFDGEKQRWSAGFFSKTHSLLKDNKIDSTFMIISQIRKTMRKTIFQQENYRTGGQAFNHAMHQEVWLWEKQKLDGSKFGEKRVYGIDVGVRVKKNKTARPYGIADFTILYDYGVDDISSLFKYVVGIPSTKSPKTWNNEKFTSLKSAVNYIERNNYEEKIRKEGAKKFKKVEDAFKTEISKRKKRWNSPLTN